MKKLFFSFSVMALGMATQAAVLSGNCNTVNNISTTATNTFAGCTALSADAGFFLSNITVTGIGTWSDSSNGGATQHAFSYAFALVAPLASVTATSATGTVSGNAVANGSNAGNFGLTNTPGGTITVNPINGTAFPFSSDTATLSYTATQSANPVQGTPEPTTLSLMGSALVALGVLARRKQ